jgi:hypothetical protein
MFYETKVESGFPGSTFYLCTYLLIYFLYALYFQFCTSQVMLPQVLTV